MVSMGPYHHQPGQIIKFFTNLKFTATGPLKHTVLEDEK